MAIISARRCKNFDILQEGLFDFLVDDKLDLIKRQAASIMKLYDVARYDYSYSSGYFHLCTAFGKSYLIKAIAEAYNSKKSGKKIIVLEENRAVVKQMARELTINSSLNSSDVGMFFSEKKDINTPVIVCTYASMKKMIDQVGRENIGLVLCDEAHHILSENRQNVAKEFSDCALYGFTATSDYGEQDKNCATVFGPVIDSVTVRDGIERDGLLCSTKTGLFLSNIPVDLTRAIAPGYEDYDPNILDELLRASHADGLRRGLADWYLNGVDETIGDVFGKATIINVPSVAEANRLAKEFNSVAKSCGMQQIARAYHTKSEDWVLDDFNAGKFPVLIQVNKLTEGYNNPNVTICINYPTHSIVRSVQCSGRALRFNPNDPNKCALVLDVAFARRSADLSENDVLSRIYENGQRLFYDVLGTVNCLNPDDKRKQNNNPQNQKNHPHKNLEFPKVFRVVTSIEFTKMVTEHKNSNPDIAIKTDEWLSANDLDKDKDFPCNTWSLINAALTKYELDPEFAGDIQTMKTSGNICKCLRATRKQAFAEKAGFKVYPYKTAEWLSANDLAKDKDFPSGKAQNIKTALEKFQYDPDFAGDILDMKAGGIVCKCLRATRKQAFADRVGFKAYPPKTDEWLSAIDLMKDNDFPGNTSEIINAAIIKYSKAPEFADDILDMKAGGVVCKCLRATRKQAFAEMAGFKAYPPKTDEWLSVYDLMKDEYFPSGMHEKIRNMMVKLEHNPEFEGYIQDMKNGPRVIKCIHIDKKQAFIAWAGFKAYPTKTDEWLSVYDLLKDEDVPSGTPDKIRSMLTKFEHDPEFEGCIQDMKIMPSGRVSKCLRATKKQAFTERAGFKAYPTKTDEWLSAKDLRKDRSFPRGKDGSILAALEKLQYDPEFIGDILDMKASGNVCKCLRATRKQDFADRAGFKAYPPKTHEWVSANDLAKDKDFPSGVAEKIRHLINKLEHDPEFDGYILDMKTIHGGQVCKCLHISKKEVLAKILKRDILRNGIKAVNALNDMNRIKENIKSDDQHQI